MKKVNVKKTNIRRVRKAKRTKSYIPYIFLVGTLVLGVALAILFVVLQSQGDSL